MLFSLALFPFFSPVSGRGVAGKKHFGSYYINTNLAGFIARERFAQITARGP